MSKNNVVKSKFVQQCLNLSYLQLFGTGILFSYSFLWSTWFCYILWIECEQPNIFLYLESTIRRYGKFHNRCWGKTFSWNDETYSPLIIDKTKKWSRHGRFLLNWLVWHVDSRRTKPVKTKTHISTHATTKYSKKSNITLMNIMLSSGLSQACLLYDTYAIYGQMASYTGHLPLFGEINGSWGFF